jgi:hypothetical protein
MTKLFGKSKSKSHKPGGKRSMFASVGQSLGLLAAVRRRRCRRRSAARALARRSPRPLPSPRAQDEPSVDVATLGPEDRECFEEWGMTLAQEVRSARARSGADLLRRCGGGGGAAAAASAAARCPRRK